MTLSLPSSDITPEDVMRALENLDARIDRTILEAQAAATQSAAAAVQQIMSGGAFAGPFSAWFASLPTAPPSAPAAPWNNGGILTFTAPET